MSQKIHSKAKKWSIWSPQGEKVCFVMFENGARRGICIHPIATDWHYFDGDNKYLVETTGNRIKKDYCGIGMPAGCYVPSNNLFGNHVFIKHSSGIRFVLQSGAVISVFNSFPAILFENSEGEKFKF